MSAIGATLSPNRGKVGQNKTRPAAGYGFAAATQFRRRSTGTDAAHDNDSAEGDVMTRPSWAPPEIDLNRPSAARVYDFYLGGFHNFPADRAMAQEAIRMWPELPVMMQANRAFLRRAIRFAVGRGITQFLAIGSG